MTSDDLGEVLEGKVRKTQDKPGNKTLLDKVDLETQLTGTFTERVLEFCSKDGSASEYSVIMFDIDYFKAINDMLSHQHGDQVLAELAALLEEYAQSQELIGVLGKKGGEEFLIALPYASSRMAGYIADELRQLVHEHCFGTIAADGSLLNRVTMSLGVNTVGLDSILKRVSYEEETPTQRVIKDAISRLLEGADTALSMAKYLGRDNVQVFREYLADEKRNLDIVRKMYFMNAWKMPRYLKDMFADRYFDGRESLANRMKKHFLFARTELNRRDTRTLALLADNAYRMINSEDDTEKRLLVSFAKRYSQSP